MFMGLSKINAGQIYKTWRGKSGHQKNKRKLTEPRGMEKALCKMTLFVETLMDNEDKRTTYYQNFLCIFNK
jgi:hypothetical protein